jgi:hypothetical protein
LYQNKHTLGVPIFVSEWGTPGEHPNTQGFVNWLQTNRVPHASWAVNNKDEPLSYFASSSRNFSGPWNPNSELTSTGKIFLKLLNDWKAAPASVTPPPPAPPVIPPAPPAPIVIPPVIPPAPPAPPVPTSPSLRVEAEAFQQQSDVGVQTVTQVRFTKNKAWIVYNLSAPNSGNHDVEFRVRSRQGATFRLDTDAGKNILGVYTIPRGNDWTNLKGTCTLPGKTIRLGVCSLSDTEWELESMLFTKK